MVARRGVNDTIRKFGFPETLVREYTHWMVLLRPAQPTLGSLTLAAKSDATSFAALHRDAYAELGVVTRMIEAALTRAVAYERINYLVLMMVDPHVHMHVIPRYSGERTRLGVVFPDHGWPKLPELGHTVTLTAGQISEMTGWLTPLFG